MKIQCKFCKAYNENEKILCGNCSKSLWTKDEVAKKLLNRLSRLEQNYQQEVQAIRKDIFDFNNSETSTPESIIIPEKLKKDIQEVISTQNKDIASVSQLKSKPEPELKPDPKSEPEPKLEPKLKLKPKPEPKPPIRKLPEPVAPSEFDLKIKEFLSPINEGLELLFGVYSKYKKERKLPIFFMTIAGIVAILFGFGYLMQLSLKYLGQYQEVVKIGLGFTSAAILCVIGIRLSKRGKTLKEYGSALISLGILLNYLMIYFLSDLGNFPVLSSGILGFCFVCINTLVSIFFSLKYEAKVISVISIIGGAFAPIYLNAMGDGTLYYLYLWFLAVGSCYVSRKIDWKVLNYLTFAVTLGSLEFMVFNQSPSNIIYTIYYHLFAYLFFFISLYDGLRLKKNIVKADIIILASSLSFFLYNLFNAFESNLVALGVVYITNGLVFSSILLVKWKDISRDTKLVLFVAIGVLTGFAIPSIFDQKLMGLFWSIEALLLVILGFQFSIPIVRKEGYILLVIALGKLVFSSFSIIEHWDEAIWHQGFLNYLVLGAVFTSLWILGQKYLKQLIEFEGAFYSFIKEIVPFWLASVYLILGYHLIGVWIFNLSIIPLFGLIYWKKHFKTNASDIIGLAHILPLLAGIIVSIQITGSFHLSDQKLYAQIAMIEFMATLWALKSFYIVLKMEDEDTFLLVENFRIFFFFLLPLIFINFIRRHAFEFIESGVWMGTMITYFLSKKLKYQALQIEFFILSIIGFFLCYLEWDSVGFISGIVFVVSIFLLEKALDYETLQKSIYKHYILVLPFVLTVFIGSFIFSLNDNFLFIRRHTFELIELGVWIGAMITYFLSKRLKYHILQIEFYILSVIGFFLCYLAWDSVGFILGIAFVVSIVMLEKALNYETLQKSIYKQYLVVLPFVLTALIGSFIFSLNDNFLPLSLSISSLSLLALVYFYDTIGPIKKSFKLAGAIALLLNLGSLISLTEYESVLSMIVSIINLVIFSLLLNNKKGWFPILYGESWNVVMVLHQIECIIAYSLILSFWDISLTGPIASILLVIHAVIVLFVAMKNQITVLNKISLVLFAATLLKVVFHDISGFNTTQKVIVLIILGLILLSAAYGYVKLSKHFENKVDTLEKENRILEK